MVAFDKDVVWSNAKDGGYLVLGNAVYTYVVVTVCLTAALETRFWTILSLAAIGGSVLIWFLFLAIYRYFLLHFFSWSSDNSNRFASHFWPSMPIGANMAGMSHILFSSPVFWLGLILIPTAALVLDFFTKS